MARLHRIAGPWLLALVGSMGLEHAAPESKRPYVIEDIFRLEQLGADINLRPVEMRLRSW